MVGIISPVGLLFVAAIYPVAMSLWHPSPSEEEALSGLVYGIQTRKGIITPTPTGEVETGKTTLINRRSRLAARL
jgi:hypothetical protein